MPKVVKVWFAVIAVTFVLGLFFFPVALICIFACITLPIYLIVRRLAMSKEDLQKEREAAAERVAKWNAKAEEAKKKQEADRKYRELCKKYADERKAADKKAVSAVLISTDSKKSGVSAAGRAVVGGALLGPVGAIAGAASGTSKATKATFSVKYASGRVATETVDVNSSRFRELSALLHK